MDPKLKERAVIGRRAVRGSLVVVLLICLCSAPSFAVTGPTLEQRLAVLAGIRGNFTFAVIGDTRSGSDAYRKLLRLAMEYKPAFLVNTGDMVPAPGQKRWWDLFREDSKAVTVPYFLTVGNHDVNDEESEELYRTEVDLPGNELYYSFTAGDSLFIVLDSNIPGQEKRITGSQYRWLDQLLSASHRIHTFVFVHHPLYPPEGAGHHYGASLDKYPEERDRLVRLFSRHRVTIVFTGHEHLYFRKTVKDVMEVVTGGGGAPLYGGEKQGGFHHFILITVDGNGVKGRVIDIGGEVRDIFGR